MINIVVIASECGEYDSVTDFSVLSNPPGTKNVFYMEICGRDICP